MRVLGAARLLDARLVGLYAPDLALPRIAVPEGALDLRLAGARWMPALIATPEGTLVLLCPGLAGITILLLDYGRLDLNAPSCLS